MKPAVYLCFGLFCSVSGLAVSSAFAQPANTISGVVVTAPREEVAARAEQLNAPNLINVQSAETIAKYPDFNAAEALGRIPGISLSSDTGEGRFVNIRGIDGNLNGATYGGVPLLNTNPGGTVFGSGRAVEFDTIPTGAIDGLIVSKTGMPDHEAEGLGGQIELSPRSAAKLTAPFAEVTLGAGYEPMHQHGGPYNADLAVGGRFGFDGGRLVIQGSDSPPAARAGWMSNPTPFSFVLTASRRVDFRGFDDIEEDYIDDPSLGPAFDKAFVDLQMRRYNYHRRRFGYGGEFDFQPNDSHGYYVRASIAGYVESVQKNRLTYDDLDGSPAVDPSNANGFAGTSSLSIKGTDEQETHRNQVYVVGGHDDYGVVSLDYRAAYSRATFKVGYNYNTTFNGPKGVAVKYDNITSSDFPAVSITDGTNPNDASLYSLSSLSNGAENDADKEWSYALNAFIPLHVLGDGGLKIGGEARLRDKVARPFTEDFTVPSLLLSGISGPAITDFYGGRYSNGPQIDQAAIRALAASGGGATGPGLAQDDTGYFDAREDVYAGYAMYTSTVGSWGLLAGVRVEATHARYGSFDFDANGAELGFTRRSVDYTNAFPTVQVRYNFTPRFLARATWSTGVGRPGFSQVAGATTIDFSNNIITQSNPGLQPTTGNNFDVTLEYYLPMGGIIQLGAFDKQFDNYIVSRTRNGTDPRLQGVVQFITFDNVPSAFARGLEAAYHQQFSALPGLLGGLGVEGNVTLVDSQVELRTGEKHRLPATSRFTANIAGFYEAHGLELRLSGEYVSHSLFGIGDAPGHDVIQDNRFTLDLTSSYRISDRWAVYFSAKNLTNQALRYYEGASNRPIQREFYDITLEAGVKLKL